MQILVVYVRKLQLCKDFCGACVVKTKNVAQSEGSVCGVEMRALERNVRDLCLGQDSQEVGGPAAQSHNADGVWKAIGKDRLTIQSGHIKAVCREE